MSIIIYGESYPEITSVPLKFGTIKNLILIAR